MSAKIRLNDEVILLTGKDKGKRGKVKKIVSSERLIIDGINLIKKHEKSIPSINQLGGINKKEAGIHISNVAIFNVETEKPDRVGFRLKNNKKIRYFKSNKKTIN